MIELMGEADDQEEGDHKVMKSFRRREGVGCRAWRVRRIEGQAFVTLL